ncbi:hypothetical protein L596_003376 [Steinernema carpocapsae]|uniref:Protein kinase domain-containing protein n=1 Tax=Steinernema carpocapsae TaxID=34508 RepID=A0A4U8UWC5_STECR|nr:hypothetical protein L596_003376 [Steinernema carpocapsae]
MPLIDRFKNLFRGQQPAVQRQLLPHVIKYDEEASDHWSVVGELGDGAFGKVEKVINRHDQNLLAASKVIEIEDGEELKDFVVEIEILVGCKHENIVGLLDCFYADSRLSIMLEFCAGGAVDGIMVELDKPLTEPQIAYISKYVCKAMIFLHENGVIHRDLKAGNVLLTSNAVVKLADFGVSAIMKDKFQRRNTFIGTPYWMAPEVIACETFNDQPYDCKADVWSFGITLIEMAQMEPPNSEVSAMRVLIKIQKSEPPKLCDPGRWTMFFNDFLTRCLVKNPSERCCATDLLTHPFLENNIDRKSVEQLLLEVNADVKEEIVEEDRQSCDESVADSEDAESRSVGDSGSLERSAESEELTARMNTKKRAAPQPPQPVPVEEDAAVKDELQNNEIVVRAEPVMSVPSVDEVVDQIPNESAERNEAIEILDDLFDVLDHQETEDAANNVQNGDEEASSPHRMELLVESNNSSVPDTEVESAATSPQVPHKSATGSIKKMFENGGLFTEPPTDVTHKAVPTRTIHDICEQARKAQQPGVSTDFPGRTEVNSRVDDKSETNYAKPVNLCVNADDDDELDVHNLRHRFESGSVQEEPEAMKNIRSPVAIPEGLVKRNREIVEVDQLTAHARDGAAAIREKRKKDDAELFSQSDVSRIAASFTVKPPADIAESTMVQIRSTRNESDRSHENRPTSLQNPRVNSAVPFSILTKSASYTVDEGLENSSVHDYVAERSPVRLAANRSKSTEAVPEQSAVSYFGSDSIVTKKNLEELSIPPPEPPVDYDEPQSKACVPQNNSRRSLPIATIEELSRPPLVKATELQKMPVSSPKASVPAVRNAPSESKPLGGRKANHRQTVTKKTRTYVVDGVEVTSTTLHVLGAKQDFELRKQEMQDLKRMQREEARQHKELVERTELLKEQLHRKFGQEQLNLHKSYEGEIDNLGRTQKRQMEETERAQDDEMKQTSKRLKIEQEKELRSFRERQKQEIKILKQEIEFLPKSQRKDRWRDAKEEIERRHAAEEKKFTDELEQTHNFMMNRLRQNHLERMTMMERQFLEQRHQLERSRESADWELEERRIIERQQLLKQALKDQFFLQRSHMLGRHQKELDHVRKINLNNEDELMRALALDRKKLPKMLRAESKTRTIMFKESLRINMQGENVSEWSERMRRFDDQEKIRIRTAMEEHERKCKKRLQTMRDQNLETVKELEEIQNEKRKMLLETEQSKLSEFEGDSFNILQNWKEGLSKRKEVLEERFARELETQERFYHVEGGMS